MKLFQKKAAEEIRSICGDTPRDVTVDDLPKMLYMEMCIKDVLRLVPIAPFFIRKTLEDFEIGID